MYIAKIPDRKYYYSSKCPHCDRYFFVIIETMSDCKKGGDCGNYLCPHCGKLIHLISKVIFNSYKIKKKDG